jgi:hypothetical protein
MLGEKLGASTLHIQRASQNTMSYAIVRDTSERLGIYCTCGVTFHSHKKVGVSHCSAILHTVRALSSRIWPWEVFRAITPSSQRLRVVFRPLYSSCLSSCQRMAIDHTSAPRQQLGAKLGGCFCSLWLSVSGAHACGLTLALPFPYVRGGREGMAWNWPKYLTYGLLRSQ